MRLKDIMSRGVASVGPDETLERAQALMGLRGIHHLVVIDRHRVVGMLTEATVRVREAEGVARVADAMTRHVPVGSPEMSVREAANLMRGRGEGALPVFAGKNLVGIVTVSDLLDLLGGAGILHKSPRRPARGLPGHPRQGLVRKD